MLRFKKKLFYLCEWSAVHGEWRIQGGQNLWHMIANCAHTCYVQLLINMKTNMKKEEFSEHPVHFGVNLTLDIVMGFLSFWMYLL